jgi:hypothetical protein
MILVPVVLTSGLSLLVDRALSSMAMDAAPVTSVPMCLAALWLLSYRLEPLSRRRTFFGAVAILATMGYISAVCYSGLSPDILTAGFMLLYVVGACAILLALTVARFFCRRSYSPTVFMLWLLLCFALMCTCLTVPLPIMEDYAWFIVISAIAEGVVAALIAYIVLLPFMILAFRNSLYRARFNTIFRIEQIGSEPATDTDEAGKETLE